MICQGKDTNLVRTGSRGRTSQTACRRPHSHPTVSLASRMWLVPHLALYVAMYIGGGAGAGRWETIGPSEYLPPVRTRPLRGSDYCY